MRALVVKSDWSLIAAAVLLSAYGLAMIYSCTHGEAGPAARRYVLQLGAIGLGVALLAAMALFDYIRLQPLAWPLYGISLALLILVLFIGGQVRGAQRWIPLGPLHLQPTELAKIAVVIAMAAFLCQVQDRAGQFKTTLAAFGIAVPAMVLAIVQPDMGTPVVLVGAWLTLAYVGGARPGHLVAVVVFLCALFAGAWAADIIKPHQKARLLAFANPEADPQGQGWQVRQALIAVGAGHLLGQGYMRGTQTQLAFIPDQESDFIFTAVAEELGFVGACAAIGLLGLVVYRALSIAAAARENFGRLLAAGMAGVFMTHIIVNVGMTIGLLPVKGMPLPFMSYGGSHMIACMIMVGLLNNIHIRRQRIDFDF